MREQHPALARLIADHGAGTTLDLATKLGATDLVTLLLEVARQRAGKRRPADVLEQYRNDRFVKPGHAGMELQRLQVSVLDMALAGEPSFEPVMLSPVAPFGTHSTLGTVPQNNVLTTTRLTEVTADPTNSLALEAAMRRRDLLRADPRSTDRIRLCSVHRVLRTQRFEGPRSFAHFSQLGLITAGRDPGHRHFESESLVEHISALARIVRSVTTAPIRFCITDFDGSFKDTMTHVIDHLGTEGVDCEIDPTRTHGKGYYDPLCFKLLVRLDDEHVEIGDGGFVDWTAKLVQSRKERLAIAGIGLDRLLMAAEAHRR